MEINDVKKIFEERKYEYLKSYNTSDVPTAYIMELKEVIKKTFKGIALSIVELGQDDELAATGCVVSPCKKSPMSKVDQIYWGYDDGKTHRRIDEVSFSIPVMWPVNKANSIMKTSIKIE